MSGWKSTQLGDVCEVVAGQSPKGEYYNDVGDGVPFYQGKKQFGDRFLGSPEKWTTSVSREAFAGDILMSVRAPVGPINIATQTICIGRGLAAIRPKPNGDVNRDFVYYALLAKQDEIKGTEGAVYPSINKTQIQRIPFELPPLDEQERIVAMLDEAFAAIDAAIANTETNLANARELFNTRRENVFAAVYESWPRTTLGELCDRMEYGTSAKSVEEGMTPVLRMGNLVDGAIDWGDLKYTSDDEQILRYSLQPGDVLFNRTNSEELVGKSAIYRGERPAIFAGYLVRIHYKPDVLDPEYLNLYLNSERARVYGRVVMSKSINQANINATKLKGYPIACPPLAEQKDVAASLNRLAQHRDQLLYVCSRKVRFLNELKQSILHKAFTGELTGTPAELEAVS